MLELSFPSCILFFIFLCRAGAKAALIPETVALYPTFINTHAWLWPEIERNMAIVGEIDIMFPLILHTERGEHSPSHILIIRKHHTNPKWGKFYKTTGMKSSKNIEVEKDKERWKNHSRLKKTKETSKVNETHGLGHETEEKNFLFCTY